VFSQASLSIDINICWPTVHNSSCDERYVHHVFALDMTEKSAYLILRVKVFPLRFPALHRSELRADAILLSLSNKPACVVIALKVLSVDIDFRCHSLVIDEKIVNKCRQQPKEIKKSNNNNNNKDI